MRADERRHLRRVRRRSCAGGPPLISSAATRVRRGRRLRQDLEGRDRRAAQEIPACCTAAYRLPQLRGTDLIRLRLFGRRSSRLPERLIFNLGQ